MKLLAIVFVLCGWASTAAAQYGAPPPPPPPPPSGGAPGYYQQPVYAQPAPGIHRSGFLIGFSLGGGSFNCDTCSDDSALSGFGLDIHLGGMISPTVGVMFDGWGVAHPLEGGGNIVHVMDTAAVQAWISPQFWLKGGLGIGQLSISDDNGQRVAESETGFGGFAAAGFELYQGSTFALDIQGRIGSVKYDEVSVHMGALTVGLNWY